MRKIRMNVYLEPDVNERLDLYSEKFGIGKSTLVAMSVRAGLDAIIRALSPQDALTPEMWAKIVGAYDQIKLAAREDESLSGS